MNGFQYKHGDRPLEGYTIQRAVGRGGFGEVYFALSDSGREVALKAIQGYEQIELRGVSQCMNLKSPHLVTIFDVRHNADNRPFVIMEYVAGPSLKDLLEQSPSGLGPQKSAFFLREIAKGLTFLHDRGIVHRDLKPGNIFYEDGYVKIGDYGLSKAMSASRYSGQTITVGTVHYMAPEIGQGRYDAGVDIYAMGCCLYEMLTGSVPFFGASHGEILMKHLMAQPDLTGIEEPFATAIKRALAKEPGDRFKNAQEMVEAVFGAEHIRDSVSCFAPESLSVVAGRVAQKVVVGGPGSSADAVRLGPPPVPPPGDGWQDFGQRMNQFGERMGHVGQRIGERLQTVSDRLAGRFSAGQAPAEYVPAAPGKPMNPSAAAFAEAARLDPLKKGQRLLLSFITATAISVGSGYVGGQALGPMEYGMLLAALLTWWGMAGALLARKRFGHWLEIESGVFPRLVCGLIVCGFCAMGAAIFMFMAKTNNMHLQSTEDTFLNTLMAVGIVVLLSDWRSRTDPRRGERVSLGPAIMAGFMAWVLASFMDGAALLAGGILAGISLTCQSLAPFNPQGGSSGGYQPASARRAGAAAPPYDGRSPAGAYAAAPAAEYANGGFAARPLAGPRPAWPAPPRQLHQTPGVLRLVFAVLAAIFAGVGLMLLISLGMVRWSSDEAVICTSFGVGTLGLALLLAIRAGMSAYSGIWTSFVRPVLMFLCGMASFVAMCMLGMTHLCNEEAMIAIGFIVFPMIFMGMLLFINQRVVSGLLGSRPPVPGTTEQVSDRDWDMALAMSIIGIFTPVSGLERFYVGKIASGVLWLLTCGLFKIGAIVDLVLVAAGQFTDCQGRRVVRNPAKFKAARQAGSTPPIPPPQPAPDARYDGFMDPAQPAAAGPDRMSPAVTASWNVPDTRALASARMWNIFGTWFVTMAMLAVLVVAAIPMFTAAGLPDGPASPVAFDKQFGYDEWPVLLMKLALVGALVLMLPGLIALIHGRRTAGIAHVIRGVVGTVALAGSLLPLYAVMTQVHWSETFGLTKNGQSGRAIEMMLDRMMYTSAIAFFGLFLLAGVVLLSWPRKQATRG